MKKICFVIACLVSGVASAQTVNLNCYTEHKGLSPETRTQYTVSVEFLEDGAILNVDGKLTFLTQQYDAPVAFYSMNPWYNLQIGNRDYSTKYALGVPSNEPFALYLSCDEIN